MNKFKILFLSLLFLLSCCRSSSAQSHSLVAEFLFNLGKVHFQEQRYFEAESDLEKCLLITPGHHQAKELLKRCREKAMGVAEVKSASPSLTREKPKENTMLPTKILTFPYKQREEISTRPKEKEVGFRKERTQEKAMLLAFREAEQRLLEKKSNEEKSPVTHNEAQDEESAAPPIHRGAWTLKKGQVYTEVYTKYYWHKHQFDNHGHKKRWDYGGEYYEIATEYKIEYGLTDRHTLMLYLPFKEVHWKDDFRKYSRNGFVYLWPGIKYLIFKEPFICSLQHRLKFPLNINENATPALGKQQIDGEIKLLTAQSWPRLPGYTKFELGFRARNEEPANEIPYFLEFGYNLMPSLILKTTLDGQEGLSRTGGIDEDWVKFTVGPILKISDLFSIEFGYGNTFSGKNSSAAQELFLSLVSQW